MSNANNFSCGSNSSAKCKCKCKKVKALQDDVDVLKARVALLEELVVGLSKRPAYPQPPTYPVYPLEYPIISYKTQ